MSGMIHLRYIYPGEGLSRPAACGALPRRWQPCRPPAKADSFCPTCAAIAARWRSRPMGTHRGRFVLARAAGEEMR